MPKSPSLSDKEAALIAAARKEAAARTHAAQSTVSPLLPATPPASESAIHKAPPSATPDTVGGGGATPVDPSIAPVASTTRAAASSSKPGLSTDERFAAMVMAEQREKERRNKMHQRWKIGGTIVLAVLLLYFALSMRGTLRAVKPVSFHQPATVTTVELDLSNRYLDLGSSSQARMVEMTL